MFARLRNGFRIAAALVSARQEPEMGMGIGMSDRTAPGGLGPFDPYWTDEAPRRRRGRLGWGRRVAMGLAAGVGLVGVAVLGPAPASAPSPASRIAAAPPSGEIVDPKSRAAVRFGNERRSARARYEARIDPRAATRRDDLSLGALEGEGPALRVEMWKDGGARAAGGPVRRNRRGSRPGSAPPSNVWRARRG